MSKIVNCPCGATVRAETDDELISQVQTHAREMAKPEA